MRLQPGPHLNREPRALSSGNSWRGERDWSPFPLPATAKIAPDVSAETPAGRPAYGLQTMCGGGGMANATTIERAGW
jgi:hypothetical protein